MQSTRSKKNNVSRYIHEDEAFWKKHQSNFAISGLSRVEYCQVQKINYGRFTYWLSKLSSATSQEHVNNKQPAPKRPAFLSVQVKAERQLLSTLCSLTLKNGLTLQIHDPSVLSWIWEEAN